MNVDERIQLATRTLTILAFVTFVGWAFLATRVPWLFFAALGFAIAAYAGYLIYSRRNPVERGGYGSDARDRVEDGSDVAVSPGVSAGGIHLSFETRSRWRARR